MGARGSVRVWVHVLTYGNSWFGACLGAVWAHVLTNGSSWFGACLSACWARVLTNGSSWFGTCLGACLGACTDQWKLVVRCVLSACW